MRAWKGEAKRLPIMGRVAAPCVLLMAKGRDKVAESLSDILQMISSRKRNGLLSVERYNASRFEEGEVYFEKGRPVQAFFEMSSGQDALTKLLTWRNVYYSFTADIPVPLAPLAPGSDASLGSMPPPSVTRPLPGPQRTTTGPLRHTQEPLTPSPTTPFNRSAQYIPPTTGPQPSNPQTPPPRFPTQGREPSRERITGYGQTGDEANTGTGATGFGGLIPYRLSDEQNVLALPLTRPQRSIYLLVDGSRTVSDLARCIGKSGQEVEQLLMELKRLGFIGL